MKVVGSMTTLPNRLSTIQEPILYILRQTEPLDILYLNIPEKTLKGQTYNIPADFTEPFNNFFTKVIINRCKVDYGPITKLAPVLSLETDPDTIIITFDDDIIIHRNTVKTLKEKSIKFPKACLGFSGICIGSWPFYFHYVVNNTIDCEVDWIQGVHSALYKRKFFSTIDDLINYGDDTPLKDVLVFNDDHRISSYLASRNVPRVSIGDKASDYMFKYHNMDIDALSHRHISLSKEHFKIIKYFSSKNMYNHTYSITNSLFFIIFSAILFGYIISLFFKNKHIIIRITVVIIACILYLKIQSRKNAIYSFKKPFLLK